MLILRDFIVIDYLLITFYPNIHTMRRSNRVTSIVKKNEKEKELLRKIENENILRGASRS